MARDKGANMDKRPDLQREFVWAIWMCLFATVFTVGGFWLLFGF